MVDVNCVQCGKKVGEASKPTRDATDTSSKVQDYAVICNVCCSKSRTSLKKTVINKMRITEKVPVIIKPAEGPIVVERP